MLNLLDTSYECLCRSYCLDSAPATIATPTLATAERHLTARQIVQSDVTEQHHRLVLVEPDVEAHAPPADAVSL